MNLPIISEPEFKAALIKALADNELGSAVVGCVTGPGRSGAIAAVYASHILHVPFIPYGANAPTHLGSLLIIDTAINTGYTLRKAERKYSYAKPVTLAVFNEPPLVGFWYEAKKPQYYLHELKKMENAA